jgi:DNA polymerase III epsilon subunit-like protein
MLANADMLIAHNIDFDVLIMMAAFSRMSEKFAQAVAGLERVRKAQTYCTMKETTNICKLPGSYGKFKWPKLTEAHEHFFGTPVEGAHDAMTDVRACKRIFFEIKKHEAGDPISF